MLARKDMTKEPPSRKRPKLPQKTRVDVLTEAGFRCAVPRRYLPPPVENQRRPYRAALRFYPASFCAKRASLRFDAISFPPLPAVLPIGHWPARFK